MILRLISCIRHECELVRIGWKSLEQLERVEIAVRSGSASGFIVAIQILEVKETYRISEVNDDSRSLRI